jgi:hypothetical protein
MQTPPVAWVYRARLARVIAHCEHGIELLMCELVDTLGSMGGNVDADLPHHGDRLGPHLTWFCSRARDFELVSGVVAEQAFCHLAPR